MVESCGVDIYAEHPPHKREQPRVFTPVALDEDSDCPSAGLPGAYDSGLSRVTQYPKVFSLGCEHIHPVRRQPPQDIDGEVEPVGWLDSNGVAVVGVSIRRSGRQGAVITTGAVPAASAHDPNTQPPRGAIQWQRRVSSAEIT